MVLIGALVLAVLYASPEDAHQQACMQTFKVLVGDINDKNFGRSIAGRIQSLNVGLRELGWAGKNREAWAMEVPVLVKILRKNRMGFVAFCKSEVKEIVSPCEPYRFGTEEYRLCVRERLPEFSCFTDRGPWRFLADLKPGTLNDDQATLAEFMVSAASSRRYCAGGSPTEASSPRQDGDYDRREFAKAAAEARRLALQYLASGDLAQVEYQIRRVEAFDGDSRVLRSRLEKARSKPLRAPKEDPSQR